MRVGAAWLGHRLRRWETKQQPYRDRAIRRDGVISVAGEQFPCSAAADLRGGCADWTHRLSCSRTRPRPPGGLPPQQEEEKVEGEEDNDDDFQPEHPAVV